MMLHHPARRAAGAAGIDDAGLILAGCGLGGGAGGNVGGVGGDQIVPQMAGRLPLRAAQRLHADDEAGLRADDGRHQRLRQLGGRDDDGAGAAVDQDMLVIAGGVGGVGRHGDAARRHDRQVGDAEFGPILADQHDRVAGLEAQGFERGGQGGDPAGDLIPAERMPCPVALAPQKGGVAALCGAREEHGDKVGKCLDGPQGSTPAVPTHLACA